MEVFEGDAALADADGLVQRGARGLVAHVGAVRQVVGAEFAGEELEEERGLVAGAARGVEEGLVGGGEGGQLLGDDLEGPLPGDGLVPVGALGQVHGLGDAALLAQPVPGASGEVGERVLREEVRGDPAQRGFLGDGLGAVLAEFGGVSFVAFGPGAARAVEAVLLVDLEQGARGAGEAHLLLGDAQGVADRGQAGGGVLGGATCGASCTGSPAGGLVAMSLPFEQSSSRAARRRPPRVSGCSRQILSRPAGPRRRRNCHWGRLGSGAWQIQHRRRPTRRPQRTAPA